jgi:hypothetical protein
MTTAGNESGTDDRMVVAYFSDGAHASRAISELIDEGFSASEIGAAFRTRRTGGGPSTSSSTGSEPVQDSAVGEMTGRTEENPAVSGSVGGPASHDQAVTPAGLAPGSGNAFPAPSAPGPIPGGELPRTLPHDLPSTLPSDLPSTLRSDEERNLATAEPVATSVAAEERRTGRNEGTRDESWWDHVKHAFGGSHTPESSGGPRLAGSANQKFGTGEGHLGLYPQYDYSAPAFEGSFQGMGLGANEARALSGELSRGGAVVTVNATQRASLAEAILERNHGRVRLERPSEAAEALDMESRVEVYGSMRDYYGREDDLRQRRAS